MIQTCLPWLDYTLWTHFTSKQGDFLNNSSSIRKNKNPYSYCLISTLVGCQCLGCRLEHTSGTEAQKSISNSGFETTWSASGMRSYQLSFSRTRLVHHKITNCNSLQWSHINTTLVLTCKTHTFWVNSSGTLMLIDIYQSVWQQARLPK